jgi:hypothetical protein
VFIEPLPSNGSIRNNIQDCTTSLLITEQFFTVTTMRSSNLTDTCHADQIRCDFGPLQTASPLLSQTAECDRRGYNTDHCHTGVESYAPWRTLLIFYSCLATCLIIRNLKFIVIIFHHLLIALLVVTSICCRYKRSVAKLITRGIYNSTRS